MNKVLLTLVLVVALAVRLTVVIRNDEMWDEIWVVRSGEIYLGGIKNLDFKPEIWSIISEHPPMAKYIFGLAGTIERNIPILHQTFDSEFHHDKGYFLPKLVSTFIGLVTIYLVYFVTAKWFDEKKAFFAGLFLALMPHFIAHNAIAGLETPQALFSLLLVYFYIEGLFDSAKPNYRKLYLSFVFFAFLFLTKFSAIFFGFFYLFTYGYYLFKQKSFKLNLFWVNISGIFVFALLVFALWPWLWIDPYNIVRSFTYFATFHTGEYFFGSSGQPPWYYYFVYLSATTPPIILLSFFATIVFVLLKKIPDNHKRNLLLVFVWFISPFLISFIGLKQDGIRYVFPYFPPLAIIAGYGFSLFLDKVKRSLVPAVILASISTLMWSIAIFNPYYLDYYNILFGGTQNVYKNHLFDYGWWGEGINEAVQYVNTNFAGEKLSVVQMFTPQHTAPLYDERLKFMDNYDPANPPDLILLSEYRRYYGEDLKILDNYKEVHSVNVVSVPLVRIYRRIK